MDKAIRQVKWRLITLVMVLSVQMVAIPVRDANAVIPALLAGLGLFIKTPIGKSVMASLVLHAAVLAVEFHNSASATPPSDDTNKKLEVKLNPKDPMATPAGWTAPAAGNPEPIPPSGASQQVQTGSLRVNENGNSYATSYASALLQCQGRYPSSSYPNTTCTSVEAGPSRNIPTSTLTDNANGQVIVTTQLTMYCDTANGFALNTSGQYACVKNGCPTGYTVSGATCTLSDASVVQKPADGKAEIKRVGNVLYVDARDTADGLPPGVTVAPDQVKVVSNDGQKTVTTKINADGTATVTQDVARTDGSGKTDRTTMDVSAPDGTTGAVEVSGYSQKVLTGTGTQTGTTPETGGTSDAKDSTLQAIKTELQTQTDELKGTGAPTMADQAALIAAEKTKGETDLLNTHTSIKNGMSSDRSMWTSWVWTPSAQACTDPGLSANGVSVTIPICNKLGMIRDALGFLFAMFAAWDIYNSLFRRRSVL